METGGAKWIEIWKNRKRYPVLTPDIINSIDDGWLIPAIVDHVGDVRLKDIAPDTIEERDAVAALPRGLRLIYSTFLFESEVCNGGFVQFFWNGRGRFLDLVVADLFWMGAPKFAALFEKAGRIFNEEAELHQSARTDDSSKAFGELYKRSKLCLLDEEFYALNDREGGLTNLLMRFIRENPDHFKSP